MHYLLDLYNPMPWLAGWTAFSVAAVYIINKIVPLGN